MTFSSCDDVYFNRKRKEYIVDSSDLKSGRLWDLKIIPLLRISQRQRIK
jgi:hypothetical protein